MTLHFLLVLVGAIPRQRGERGATAVEYTMIVALCGFCALGFVVVARAALAGIFDSTQASVDNWVP